MERSIEGGSSRSVGAETMLVDLNDRIRLISKPSCGFSKCDIWYESGAACALLRSVSKLRNRSRTRRDDADIMTHVDIRLATALSSTLVGSTAEFFAKGNLN